MSYRKQANKPTAALWMLVAVADVVLLLASAGALVLLALASVAVATVGALGAWRHLRRADGAARVTATPVAVRVPVRQR